MASFSKQRHPSRPPQTVNHTWTIAGPSAHRHMNTWARFVSWRSCFREVNCVTVGGDTSVAERPLVGSWQTPRLLFHISINTTTSKESWLAWETPAILVNSCKWKTSISGIGFPIWYQFFAAIKLQTLEWPWRGGGHPKLLSSVLKWHRTATFLTTHLSFSVSLSAADL